MKINKIFLIFCFFSITISKCNQKTEKESSQIKNFKSTVENDKITKKQLRNILSKHQIPNVINTIIGDYYYDINDHVEPAWKDTNEFCIADIYKIDDKRVAFTYTTGNVQIRDLKTKTILYNLKADKICIDIVCPITRHRLLTRCIQGVLKIWNLETNKLIGIIDDQALKEVCQISDEQIATTHNDKIKIWNLKTGKNIATLDGHKAPLNSIILLSNGYLASCSSDKTVKIWNLNICKCIKTLKCEALEMFELSNGKLICYSPKAIKMIDLIDGTTNLLKSGDYISSACLLPNNRIAYSEESNITIMDCDTNRIIGCFKIYGRIKKMLFFENNKLMTLTLRGNYTINLWDLNYFDNE